MTDRIVFVAVCVLAAFSVGYDAGFRNAERQVALDKPAAVKAVPKRVVM